MTAFDLLILSWIQQHMVFPWLTPMMEAFTAMGNFGLIWIAVALALLIPKSTRKIGLAVALSLALVAIFNNLILKPFFARPRPFTAADFVLLIKAPGGWSFPSGHTASSFAAATAIFLQNRRAGFIALIVALLIAFSRLYFCVHYPSDVVVGMLEGVVIAGLVTKALAYTMKNSSSSSGRL